VNWEEVKKEIGHKHPVSLIWESYGKVFTSYSNFTRILHRKLPELAHAFVCLRDFAAGDRTEVDYTGGTIDWMDFRTGKIHRARVFIGILGYSHLIFAHASVNMKSASFLLSHRKMFEFFGGVSKVLAPDNTKTAVIKCHRYDPDLNPSYTDLCKHYEVAVVPARAHRPKDKALVEGAVKIVMRLFRWRYRKHTFGSIHEINKALAEVVEEINNKPHTRFKVSRRERFESEEKSALRALPQAPFEKFDIRTATVHPDGTVVVDSVFYSAPYKLRGYLLAVHVGENVVEIYNGCERVGVHPRKRKHGDRSILSEHLPENAKAYRDTTAQSLLSQAKFIAKELHQLIQDLFDKDTLGNLRLAQGLIRISQEEMRNTKDREKSLYAILMSIKTMTMFGRIRCQFYKEQIQVNRIKKVSEEKSIQRKPGNPMLRHYQQKEKNNGANNNEKHDDGIEALRDAEYLRRKDKVGHSTEVGTTRSDG
jgi:hypothetical protein